MNEIDAKWIHPNNVCIEKNKIMKKGFDKIWNSAAFSEQYLNPEDSGTIEFEVPGLDDEDNKTCDWQQGFFIGISNGCNNPHFSDNIFGVYMQQYAKPDDESVIPRMSLEIFKGQDHLYPPTNEMFPGDKVKISITNSEFVVEWNVENAINKKTVSNICFRNNPTIAKIALYNISKVVKNVKLTGDWKTVSDCSNVPFYPCKEDNKKPSEPKVHVFPKKKARKTTEKRTYPNR